MPPAVATVRSVRAEEIEGLIAVLIRGRMHISGSRRHAVYRAFLRDALLAEPRTTVAVAEVDGRFAGTALVVNSDLPGYYRAWGWRHPVAASLLVAHRLKKLPYRVRRRRQLRAGGSAADAPRPSTTSSATDADAAAARADVPPLPPLAPAPVQGPGIAFCVYVLVDRDQRGAGIGKLLVDAAVRHTRALGSTRFDCSFALDDPAASRLYPSLGFTVTRAVTGGFASIDLGPVEPRRLDP